MKRGPSAEGICYNAGWHFDLYLDDHSWHEFRERKMRVSWQRALMCAFEVMVLFGGGCVQNFNKHKLALISKHSFISGEVNQPIQAGVDISLFLLMPLN